MFQHKGNLVDVLPGIDYHCELMEPKSTKLLELVAMKNKEHFLSFINNYSK